ncbi:hypothetical protein PRNP1_012966 [Phytophthora ramorum]
MATVGKIDAEGRVPADNRSLRGYKRTEAEDEDRAISTSLDDVILKLNAGKSSLQHVVDVKAFDKAVKKAVNQIGAQKKSDLKKVFTESNLDKMLTNEKHAEATFLEWYALGLTGKRITSSLAGVGAHYGILFAQYTTFINRFKGVA